MPALRSRNLANTHLGAGGSRPSKLKIAAPQAQKVAFPESHNLSDTPISSPSNSPSPVSLSPSSGGSYGSYSLFPPPPRSAPPVPAQQPPAASKAINTSVRKDGHVKRPENAFILFRRHRCLERQQQIAARAQAEGKARFKPRQADLSKVISQEWKGLSAVERAYWETLAKEKKEAHEREHPNYVYRPRKPKSVSPPPADIWKAPNVTIAPAAETSVVSSPSTEQAVDGGSKFSLVLPCNSPEAVSLIPSLDYSYQEIIVPTVEFVEQTNMNSARSAWETYQATLQASQDQGPPTPKTPAAPATPYLYPIKVERERDVPPMALSPVSSSVDTPLFPPPPSEQLASPFQESTKMPTYQTPVEDWYFESPPDMMLGIGEEFNFGPGSGDAGFFDRIDFGFAGDYSIPGADDSPTAA